MVNRVHLRVGSARGSGTLGTFGGVFTPSILTILGIILFRRTGYVVGNAGLSQALLIVLLANVISILTSISISAIATNLRVKGGGDYYIISRTLGVEFGGAIGLVLFIAQSVSIAFYCFGFGEAVSGILPESVGAHPRELAGLAIVFLFFFAWMGADWATRMQYIVMAVLAAALVSFFIGGILAWDSSTLSANLHAPSDGLPFWAVFAVFFPAVTGFTQGVSMSGDLKDTVKSLPYGTFAAVGVSFAVYLAAVLLFAAALPVDALGRDYGVMRKVAATAWMVDAGVIAATLSSAMASFLGAPRILQALASDRILPWLNPFAHGAGPTRNPRRGILLSLVIAAVTVAVGDLNLIAPLVAMFFLISYGLLNFATYYEVRASSPSFRPRFKVFDKRLSLLGALGCFGAMFAINPMAGTLAMAVLFSVYQYIKRTAGPARWADSSRSYLFQQIRSDLLALAAGVEHPRDWRPQILALAKDDHQREQLLRFSSWIEGGSGLTSAVEIIEESGRDRKQKRQAAQDRLAGQIRDLGLDAFPLVISAPDVETALEQLLQSYGIGPLHANIVLLNWLEERASPEASAAERMYGKYLRESIRLGRNIVALDADGKEWARLLNMPVDRRRIDVWWWGGATSRLCLLLAYLMKRTNVWKDATIRVISEGGKRREKATERLARMLEEIRIEAVSEVVGTITFEAMVDLSSDAALVFVPFELRGLHPVDPFGHAPDKLLKALPVMAMALAAEDIELALEADQGKPREIAEAVEQATDADKAARSAEKRAEKAEKASEKAEARVRELEARSGSEEIPETQDVVAKEREASEAARKDAKRAATLAERAKEKADAAMKVVKNGSHNTFRG